ncbi:MAG: hypothetical protein M1836_006835 [Candelina mexicana]|nr:MAG: hypothetical protein M1836_006835 [Candelina mexicana]
MVRRFFDKLNYSEAKKKTEHILHFQGEDDIIFCCAETRWLEEGEEKWRNRAYFCHRLSLILLCGYELPVESPEEEWLDGLSDRRAMLRRTAASVPRLSPSHNLKWLRLTPISMIEDMEAGLERQANPVRSNLDFLAGFGELLKTEKEELQREREAKEATLAEVAALQEGLRRVREHVQSNFSGQTQQHLGPI